MPFARTPSWFRRQLAGRAADWSAAETVGKAARATIAAAVTPIRDLRIFSIGDPPSFGLPAQAPALGSNGPTSSVDGSVGPLQGGTKLGSALDASRVPAPFPRSIFHDTGPDSCGQAFDQPTRTDAADPGRRLTTGHPCGSGAGFTFHCGSLAVTWR